MKTLTNINPIILVGMIIFTSTPAGAQLDSKTFQKQIYIPAKEVRVDSLLRIFSRQTGVEFSFNSNKISPSKKISVTQHTQTLDQWLTTLSNTLGVEHKMVGNHIILIDHDKAAIGKKNTVPTVKTSAVDKNNPSPPVKKEVDPVAQSEKDNPNSISGIDNRNAGVDSLPTSSGNIQANAGLPGATKTDSILQLKPQGVSIIINPKAESPTDGAGDVPAMGAIQFIGGYSRHGSGDMKGIVFGVEYTSYFSKKLSLTYSMRATINSSKDEIIVHNGGSTTDASIRFTTAGVQLGVTGGFSLINNAKHEFMIKLGAFGRYQSASNGSDGYSLYNPAVTGVPTILVGYNNSTPQETIALGGIFQFQYNYTFNKKIYLGVQPAFQTDTNGDAILQGALVVGKRL